MNKFFFPNASPSKVVATVGLILLLPFIEQNRKNTADLLIHPAQASTIPLLPNIPTEDPFYMQEKIEENLYDDLFSRLHYSPETTEQFFDSLLVATQEHNFLITHDWKTKYDTLTGKFPTAKKYEGLIEKSSFLEQGVKEYMKAKEDINIDTLLARHAPHLGSYNRFLSLSRKITKHAQKKDNNNNKEHYFLSVGYVRRLLENIGGDIINDDIRRILFPEEESTQSEQSETVFPDMSQTAPRIDTIYLGKKHLITKHFPANQAHDSLQQDGRNVVGSKYGPDDGTSFARNRTCTHGLQPIVRQGLRLLEEKLYDSYQVRMDTKILRGGSEKGHFFGKDNNGVVAGQLSPSYNKKIRQGEKSILIRGILKELWFFLTTHGFGNTVDISIAGSKRIWALEDFLKKGTPIDENYKLMYLGDNIYMLYRAHEKDISYHIHCSFVTGEQLKQAGLGAYTKKGE